MSTQLCKTSVQCILNEIYWKMANILIYYGGHGVLSVPTHCLFNIYVTMTTNDET